MLTCSLFGAIRPVSAATLSWSSETIPNATDKMVVANADVVDMAIAGNGTTIFAVDGTQQHIYKSTDTGVTWTALTNPTGVDIEITSVAVAPDSVDVVGIIADDNEVYLSQNGGTDWTDLGTVQEAGQGAAVNLYDIAIAPISAGIRYIAVAGDEGVGAGTGNVWYFNLGLVATWKETHATAGFSTDSDEGVFAVAFSPTFPSDKIMVAVSGPDGTADRKVEFQIFSLSSKKWNEQAVFTNYPVTVDMLGANKKVTMASIALAATYFGADPDSRIAFVGIASDDTTEKGSLNRLVDTTLKVLKDKTNIHSVAYNTNAGKLLAGSNDSTMVYRSANPLATTVSVETSSTYKKPGGDKKVVVGWAGNTAVAGTSGTESAFAISRDNGKTFNDISLIDTTLSTLEDVYVTPDGSKVFLLSNDGTDLSLWRKASSWERVFTKIDDTGYIVRGAPDDNDVLYLAKTDATTMYYTGDAGESNWTLRSAANNIQDLAVESTNVAYIGVYGAATVSKSTDGGFTWGEARSTKLAGGNVHMIASVGKGQVIVGGTTGYVSYSTDGNSSWTNIGKQLEANALLAQVTASGLDDGDYIYAASSKATTKVLRWQIGISSEWKDISAPTTTGYRAYGIALRYGMLYVATSHSTNSKALQVTNPTKDTFAWGTVVGAGKSFNRRPAALKVSAGSTKLWAIDTTGAKLYSFIDTLATIAVRPLSPANGFQNPINPISGRSVDIVFSWNKPSESVTNYDIRIYADEAGIIQLQAHNVASTASTPAVIIGPNQAGTQYLEFFPGTTYYWRVRAAGNGSVYGPWSQMRSFSVEPLELTPPVVIEHTPQPPAPQITVEVPPPTKIEIPPAPTPPAPIVPAYIWAIVGIVVTLLITVIIVIIRTARPDRFGEMKAEHGEDTTEIVNWAKEFYSITKPNSEMTDDDIREVIRWIGEHAPDTAWVDGKPVFRRIGIGVMSIITQAEFPEFYRQYGISQFN